jgi:diguanylate cyclase (GGDEF)-like protein
MKTLSRTRTSEQGAFIVDRRGTILGFDQAMETLTGWPAVEMVGRNKELARSLVDSMGEARPIATVPLYDGEIPMVSGSKRLELTLHCRDGRLLQAELLTSRLDGPGDRLLVTVLRILSQSPGGTLAEESTRRDPLTGLPDPDTFAAQLKADVKAAGRAARPMAMVLADVDHLRDINDRHGREAGDTVLQKLAGILRVCVDDESRLCRLGDDDFAILLPDAGRGDARQLAANLRSTVERYRFFSNDEGIEERITLSLGAASFPADAESGTELLERAREALDEARLMGRNRVWCYLRKPRVPVEVPVFFDGVESLLVGYTRDLSPSGIFVQTAVPIEIGMRCALVFPLPGRDGKVHVIGRVVRTVPPQFTDDRESMRVPGMGVEFERFGGPNDRHSIEAFLHRHESETLRPEVGPLSFPG